MELNNNPLKLMKPHNIYAATQDMGIAVSNDGGKTWPITYTINNGLADNNVSDVYVDGANIYAATNNGLSASNDGGKAWITFAGFEGINGVDSIGKNIYAATDYGLFVTYDSGQHWTHYSNGLADPDVYKVAVSHAGRYIYAATFAGLSVSYNKGTYWKNLVFTEGPENDVSDVTVNQGKVYATSSAGLFYTQEPEIKGKIAQLQKKLPAS